MSDTYFCLSDENGDYKKDMKPKQLSRHPFYVRTTLIMNAGEWKKLNSNFRGLKDKYKLPRGKEIKWSYLWSLRHYVKSGKEIPKKQEFKFLESYNYHDLIDFVADCLSLIHEIKEKKVVITFTKNDNGTSINEKSMLAMHLQEHMQRIEMELRVDDGNLGVLFFDPISHE